MIWILAGNYAQAVDYAVRNELGYRDRDWAYLSEGMAFRGHRPAGPDDYVLRTGTWHERRDSGGIEEVLIACGWRIEG
jgi:hypothetical protein